MCGVLVQSTHDMIKVDSSSIEQLSERSTFGLYNWFIFETVYFLALLTTLNEVCVIVRNSVLLAASATMLWSQITWRN